MVNVELLFGPMLVGVFLNMILYGVMIMQMFKYYQTYKTDSLWIKYLVLYLFILETLNTGFDIGMMYEPLIIRYGTSEATTFFPLMFASEPIMIVAISTPIQFFIAHRILAISGSKLIAGAICFFAICSLAGGIWTTVAIVIVRRFARKPELHGPALLWFLASAVADVAITVSLVRSLYRRKTGFTVTDDVINRIIRLTVQTGMITAIAAAGDVIFFLVLPHTTLNFIWDLALTKLYTNSLMSTLNARAGLNDLVNGHHANVLFEETRNMRQPNSLGNYPTSRNLYELEAQKSSRLSSGNGVEYGIAVTKIVERLEDPLPQKRAAIQ